MAKPGATGPVGPFPDRVDDSEEARLEYDRLRRRVLWKITTGLYIVGSTDRDLRWNLMTLNWITQVSFDPKWVGISIERDAYTHDLIETSRVFSVCFVDREDRAIVRKFTKPVEVDLAAHTLNGFAFHTRATGAPLLNQSVAFLDCEVRHAFEVGNHTLFIGEVVDCDFLKDEETPLLRMEDTRMNNGG